MIFVTKNRWKEEVSVIDISEKKKFVTIAEFKNMGYTYYKIGRLEEEGKVKRVNRSTYENLSYSGDENDFFSAEAYVPDGVICLMSAARYYDLTDFVPDAVDVAIARKKKVSTFPDWPELRIYYFDPVRMNTGVIKVQEGENAFHVFDIEKTVVDIIYYRNKVGIEETSGILKKYLAGKNRQIDILYEYAKKLRCEKTIRTYLEVLM